MVFTNYIIFYNSSLENINMHNIFIKINSNLAFIIQSTLMLCYLYKLRKVLKDFEESYNFLTCI